MIFKAADWFLRDEYWRIEGGRKTNDISKPRLTKAEQNGLVKAPSTYQVLVIPHQPTNELVSPDSFRF
jgi:hypothetical protein